MKLPISRENIMRYIRAVIYSLPLLLVVTVVCAAEHGGGHEDSWAMWKDFGFRVLNTAILVGFLYWFLASKVRDFFSGRRRDIKQALADADKAKADAEQKYREYEAKLTKATDEITGVVEMIKSQGLAERDKIIDDAKKAAEKMKEDTKARMEQELIKAGSQLRQEAAQLSVQMAEEILKRSITPADHENMVKDYLDKVVIKH
ncbi:MAG: F0F1 ATP synthase subunit B [Syntrophaceae bacterium]|nr:F0F1 ATP synthase subunit B [Syntrophaceae bacterium]